MEIESKKDEIEISLIDIFKILWSKKFLMVAFVLVSSVLSAIYALSIPNEYKSSAKFSFTQDETSSSSPSQLGGIASLAGISLGNNQSNNESTVAYEIMQSWNFIEDFIEKNELEYLLSAVNGWNQEDNSLIINSELYNHESKKWLVEKPSSWILYKKFKKRVSVSQDMVTGLVTISIEYFSPYVAKQLIDQYVDSINSYMFERKLQQIEVNLSYLQAQLERTNNKDMKFIFYSLIEEQIKNKMLAQATPEYSLTTINKAMTPSEKTKPQRSIMVLLGAMLGAILGMLYILASHYKNSFRV